MPETAESIKVSERGKGKLVSIATLHEGTARSFDGTKLFYRSFGRGQPPLICCNGLGVSSFFWVYFERYFRVSHQVVTWDYRGHGHSELKKNPKNFSISALVKDCIAVLDTLEIKKGIFLGHSLGVQIIFELYRRHPDRVAGLIPCFGTYGHPMDSFYNTRLSRYLFKLTYALSTTFPTQSHWISRVLLDNPLSFFMGGLLKIMHTGMIKKEDVDRYIKHILSVDPIFFTMLLKSAQEHTAEDLLKNVRVPTLVVSGELDQFTPMWISKKMNRLIPKSELFIMQKASHAGLVEQPDLINLRIEKFLNERIGRRR